MFLSRICVCILMLTVAKVREKYFTSFSSTFLCSYRKSYNTVFLLKKIMMLFSCSCVQVKQTAIDAN